MRVDESQAANQLSQLLDRVERGEEVIVERAGKPIARLVPYAKTRARRVPGGWEGRVRIAEDFDELPEEIADAFGIPRA